MPAVLQLRCLGGPSLLTASGEAVRFRTRKHLALLVRMALEPGRLFTRDYLTDLLWPAAAPHLANHSLAQGLSVLKAKVARAAVLIQRATVGLAPGWVDVDVQHLASGDLEIGGPFLDGFEIPAARPFEDWKEEYRGHLLPQLRDCLVRQMDAARRIGDFATVERRAVRLRQLDPLAEEAVRGIMEARAWAGDRSNALKAFARYEAQLAEELGAKPGADLCRVADLLRDGRRPAPRPAGVAEPMQRLERRFEPETLIGREREFSVLYDAWLEARRKQPRIVVLTSDPGVGKTTLANAFASSCQMDGAVVARAQAYEAERELPFAVLGELVRQLAAQRAIGGADPEALSELTRISGEILRVFPGVPKPVEWSPELMPLRLADAFLKTVTAAAEESPVVLVVDDIHAADNASTAILHMVARKLAAVRVLLILPGRTSELRFSDAPAALASDTTIEGLRALEMDVLSSEAAEQLVRQIAKGTERHDPPVERILRASGGNPLAIELLTREWAAHGAASLLRDLEALDTQPVPVIGIPRAIGTMFERQCRRLDRPTRAALDLGGIVGRRLTQLELYAVVELSPGQAAEALSRLKDEGLLREVRGDLEFRNELIRAEAYYAVAAAVRQHLHRQVGELLALNHPKNGTPCLEIAWHFLRGGDTDKGARFAIEGAELAVSAGAPAEAQGILEAVLPTCKKRDLVTYVQLLLAKALVDRSEADKAMPILEMLGKDDSLNDRDAAEVARLASTAEFLIARSPTQRRLAVSKKALTTARRTKDMDLILRALLECARTSKSVGDYEGLVQSRDEVAAVLNEHRIAESASAHVTLAYCNYYLNDITRALDSLQMVSRLEPSNPAQLAFVYMGMAGCHHMLCEFESAVRAERTALEFAQRIGDDSRCSRILANLTLTEAARGNYEEAVTCGQQAVEFSKLNPNQPEIVTGYANLADAYLLTGRAERARECLDKAREWVAAHNDWQMTVAFLCEQASWAMTAGNISLALASLGEIEKQCAGRERFIMQAGLLTKLHVQRAMHEEGHEAAKAIAEERCRFFLDRVPYFYLDALAARAWVEKKSTETYSIRTLRDLEIFDRVGAIGKRALLQAQGFLD